VKAPHGLALRFIFPSLLVVVVFVLAPILESFRLSFYRTILTLPWLGQKFVGLENYRDLLADPIAWKSCLVTVLFVAVTAPAEIALGLAFALVLNERVRGRGALRAAVLIPWAIPTVVASQMWRFIFNDQYGLFNFLLFGGRTELYLAPLADPGLALAAIMVADIWKSTPFAALIILAGLQAIPDELYEAASLDGASAWQRFRYVTWPLVRPALLLALLFRTIEALRVFDLVFVMTQGGPADATNVLQFYGYKKTFAEGMVGYGATLSVAVFFVALVLSFAYLRLWTARLWGPPHAA
jgi:ABC-type sugar transport system permease subunit